MFVHSGFLWETARAARDRAAVDVRANPKVWPSDTIVAIVLAAASTEAFINELTEMVAQERDNPSRESNPISPSLRSFADTLEEIEKARGSLSLKYLSASLTLSGFAFKKGENPYQDFAVLIDLRNDLMHLKPRDTFALSGDGFTIYPPKYIKGLQQRGLARAPEKGVGMSWLNMLQTVEMATWACDSALNIILAVLDLIPDDPTPSNDPSWGFKYMFRKKRNQRSVSLPL